MENKGNLQIAIINEGDIRNEKIMYGYEGDLKNLREVNGRYYNGNEEVFFINIWDMFMKSHQEPETKDDIGG